MAASSSNEIPFIVVMGVCGTGKSTLSLALSHKLSLPYHDADDLHPPSNVAKMSQGIPLTDADREPWLTIIRQTAENAVQQQLQSDAPNVGVIIACSALRKSYRDILRSMSNTSNIDMPLKTYFVRIDGSREVMFDRMNKRTGHFMKTTMLESQLSTFENPSGERDVVTVNMESSTEEQVASAVEALKKLGCTLIDST